MKKSFLKIILIILGLFVFTGCEKEESLNNDNNSKFNVAYTGVNVTPGTEFNKELINKEAEYSEIVSCAFEGKDKVYTYEDAEIITANINNKDTVFSVYFLSEDIKTDEGIKLNDSKTKMIEKYGSDYDNFGNKYSYIKDGVELSFIIEEEIITSIEYKYVVD